MRYIGNKTRLLGFIRRVLRARGIEPGSAVDPFTGTASVASELKRLGFRVVASDIMEYAYVFGRAYVEVAAEPSFDGLAPEIADLPMQAAVPDRSVLASVAAPALVIGCRGDATHPPQVAEQLAAALPNATLHIYDQPAVLWTNRADLRLRISEFLNG